MKSISKFCAESFRPKGVAKDIYERITGKGRKKGRRKKDRGSEKLRSDRKDDTRGVK